MACFVAQNCHLLNGKWKTVVISKYECWPRCIVRCLNSNCGLTIAWSLTMEGWFRGHWPFMLWCHAERWYWVLCFDAFLKQTIWFSTIKVIINYYLKHNYHIFVLHCLSNNITYENMRSHSLRLSNHTDLTIHWKALEEHFLMVRPSGRDAFFQFF
jgi:hypothetical protein